MIILKTPKQVEQIEHNGQILRQAVDKAIAISRPGITTYELNQVIEKHILDCGATPTFKGYGATKYRPGFPAASCCSPRNIFVHGIPDSTPLSDGDIISIDVGVTKGNCVADSCFSYGIGSVSIEHQKLLEASRNITMYGISLVRPGIRIHDLAKLIAAKADSLGYVTIPGLFGHGTGCLLHEAPTIPFSFPPFSEPIPNIKLAKDMVITIEPVVGFKSCQGKYIEDPDGWTLKSLDDSWSAQFEHTILITEQGNEILTGDFPLFVVV